MSRNGPLKLRRFRWLIAGVTAALWLFTGFLAVSPEWHHCFHEDSEAAQHHCFISKYSDGDFLATPAPAALVPVISAARAPALLADLSVDSGLDHSLPPGRAPPIL